MNDLSPEERKLLELAREGHEPSEMDRRRIRTALRSRVAITAGVALSSVVAGTTTSAGAGAVAGGVSLGVAKTIALVGALAMTGGGGIWVYRAHRAAPAVHAARRADAPPVAHPRTTSVAAAIPVAAEAHLPPAETPGASDGVTTGAIAPQDARAPRQAPRTRIPAPLVDSRVSVPSRTPAEIAAPPEPLSPPPVHPSGGARGPLSNANIDRAQIGLVKSGLAALHAGDAQRALQVFEQYLSLYPQGLLVEECAAERIIALCDLHRAPDARAAAATFLRGHPASPLARRIRESCGGLANP